MLSQEIALALLQASITGAGLVLAVYALIIPLSRRLFEKRADESLALTREFKKKATESKTELEDGENMKELIDKITETQSVPDYLRIGMGGTFMGYITCALLSYAVAVNWQRPASDDLLSWVFVLTTIVFLLVGLTAIKDIHKIMEKDLAEIRKSLCDQ